MVRIRLLILSLLISINAFSTNLSEIYKCVLCLEVEHPTIVMSQIILETGHLSSFLYKNNNNMFGMRRSGSRPTTSNVIKHGYKYYNTWEESLVDYAILQQHFYKGLTREEYFDKLSRSYASSSRYIETLKKIEKNLGKYTNVYELGQTGFDSED